MIKINNLSVSFNNRKILDDINLEIENKKIFVILGPSGCGKSVLLRNIIGILKPDTGSITIDGLDIVNGGKKVLNDIRKKCGFLFQHSALFDSLTIEENLKFPLLQYTDLSEKEIRKEVDEKLEMVGLKGANAKIPSELSGGMQKRAALARSIILKPSYIFYDEPTTGLDPIMSRNIDSLIMSLNEQLGITSVVVTHDMKTAELVSDRIALLYDGKIKIEGDRDIITDSDNPYLRQFVSGEKEGPMSL